MNKSLNLFFMLAIFLMTSTTASSSSGKNIYQQSVRSVVYIESYDNSDTLISQGSGFYIKKDTVVTNFHVIKNSTYLLIYDIDGKFTYCNTASSFDVNKDIAILKIRPQSSFLTMNFKDKPNIGDNIFVISSPRGFKFSISDGILSGIRNINNINLYQMTAPISPGSSGGPVLDEKGNVIGIASSYFKDGQNINFSIPITYIKDLSKHNKSMLLSEIEDPELALDKIFFTIFDKIYYGMDEEKFLDALQGCKNVRYEQTYGCNSEPVTPGSRNRSTKQVKGFFDALDAVIGYQNIYTIDNVNVDDIHFDFSFTFNEKDSNVLNSIYANSESSQKAKYCYASIIDFFGKKFNKFKKINEKENKKRQQELLQDTKNTGYEKFFVPAVSVTTSWEIYDTLLSVSLITSQDNGHIQITWIKNIFD